MASEDGGRAGLSVCSYLVCRPKQLLASTTSLAPQNRNSTLIAMPFRDREWEDFQRDCDFFPAFSDYIFGVDDSPEVVDEPDWHPQIYDPLPPPLPRQRLYGLPPPVQNPLAYDPVRDATQTRSYSTPKLRPTSLLQHDSSMESMQSTPCPAPRILPSVSAQSALLRPNELMADPQYSYVPPLERLLTDSRIAQAWAVVNSDAIPAQKEKAMSYISSVSNVAAVKRQENQAREISRMEFKVQAGQEPKGHDATLQAQSSLQQNAFLQFSSLLSSAFREDVFAVHGYAIDDISQLPAYMHTRLPQLWACVETTMLGGRPPNPGQLDHIRQASHHMMGFFFSIPPMWRCYAQAVLNAMIKLRNEGGDPMTMLHNLPRVEDVFGIQQEA